MLASTVATPADGKTLMVPVAQVYDAGLGHARLLDRACVFATAHRYDGLTHGLIHIHHLVDPADTASGDMALAPCVRKERHA